MAYSFNVRDAELELGIEDGTISSGTFSEPLEPGEYVVEVTGTEHRANSKGTGSLIELKMEVSQGGRAGKWLRAWLNVEHQNPKAQEIGQRQLLDICKAMNLPSFEDESDLEGREMGVYVAVEYDQNNEARNTVKKFFAASEVSSSKPTPSEPQAASGATSIYAGSNKASQSAFDAAAKGANILGAAEPAAPAAAASNRPWLAQ